MNNMNNNSKRTTALAVVAGIVLVLGTAGCESMTGGKQHLSHGEAFAADQSTPISVNKFTAAQIASGARTDATLHAYHFDGGMLNSLGRDKLRAMLKDDDACEPLTVYLNTKGTGDVTARRESVSAFLMDEGLLESQIALKEGSNPLNVTPAAKGLKALSTADSGAAAPSGDSMSSSGKSGVTTTK